MDCNTKQRTDIEDKLNELALQIESSIAKICDDWLDGPDKLIDAMRYSLLAGGKRIRPALVLLAGELCGGDRRIDMVPAVAIEMVHTFSLIHDDLPAMDNDDYRRGKLTNHKVFGEAMAILAGDALLAFAFELIGRYYDGDAEKRSALMTELARATGPGGMTGGQVLDMLFDGKSGTIHQAERVHLMKTAMLIRCACRLGAISADADESQLEALSEYGKNIGLAFQIVDDLLDQTGTQKNLGKRTRKDKVGGKPNYAVLADSIEVAKQRANNLITEAKKSLEVFGEDACILCQLADLIIRRKT